jgi:hypothetical protein
MTINYTTNLALAQPVTGTESGTWGDDVNNGITAYLDIAIAGSLVLTSASFTANALTLANTQGTNASTGFTTSTAQYYILRVSSLAADVTITAPTLSKSYVVVNLDPTYTVTLKASGQTGVTTAVSSRALCVFNGTDYVQVGASAGGSTTQVQFNSSGALAGSSAFTWDGTTLSATQTTTRLKAYKEAVTTVGTVATSTYNIDLSLTNIFDITLGANVTFTFTNPPISGISQSVTVILRQDATGSRTATFTNAKYSDGVAPTLSTGANQVDVLTFFTVNGGTFWFGTFAMANVS